MNATKRDWNANIRRCGTIRRVVILSEVLRQSTYPKNLVELTDEINERTGDGYCTRTVQRDLRAFQQSGFVVASGNAYAWRNK